jgi:hypothetical protein
MRNNLAILTCSVVILTVFALVPAKANDLVADGIKAYRAGDFVKAEQLYHQALSTETDNSKLGAIYRNLAVLYSAQGKDNSEYLKKADELDPPIKAPNSVQADKLGSVLMINNPSTANQSNFQQQKLPQNTLQFNAGNGNFAQSSQASVLNSGPSVFRTFSKTDPGYSPLNGNGVFSGKFADGNFEYSNGSTIVLPKPNGGVVLLNAPGPNIQSTQQNPDGSSTTIRKATY